MNKIFNLQCYHVILLSFLTDKIIYYIFNYFSTNILASISQFIIFESCEGCALSKILIKCTCFRFPCPAYSEVLLLGAK